MDRGPCGLVDLPTILTVRVMLFGLGFAGRVLHLPALARIPDVEVVTGCDPEPSTHPPGLPCYQSYESALQVDADAAIVATPVETHFEVASAALQAGLHLYLEKPPTKSVSDSLALTRLADEKNLLLQIGFAYRFNTLWRRVRSIIRDGRLRTPLKVEWQYSARRPGAGWISPHIEVGCHHLDLTSWLIQESPSEVWVRNESTLQAKWPDGTELESSVVEGASHDRARLTHGNQTILVDRIKSTRLRFSNWGIDRERVPSPALIRARASRQGWERAFEWALSSFVRDVRSGASTPSEPAAGPRDALVSTAACEAVIESIATGQRCSVATRDYQR